MSRPTLLIATTNAGKLREVRAVLGGVGMELVSLRDFPAVPEPVEDGDTFEDNARIKASYYARRHGVMTLADDSGLEVDALDGAPGVRSARFAGPRRDDRANNTRLIEALRDVPEEDRTARFRCAIALASPDRVCGVVHAALEGVIIDAPRGDNGFGYDPHFFVPGYDMTTAQMSPEHKNRISHRGQALRAVLPLLTAC